MVPLPSAVEPIVLKLVCGVYRTDLQPLRGPVRWGDPGAGTPNRDGHPSRLSPRVQPGTGHLSPHLRWHVLSSCAAPSPTAGFTPVEG